MNCIDDQPICHLRYQKEFGRGSLIERVAKAIYCTEFPTLNSGPWNDYEEKHLYHHVAKIAIAAMIEPTDEMLADCNSNLMWGELKQIYSSMIKAALK